MKNILVKLMNICNGSLHLNVLSHNTVQRDVELFYAKPADLLAFARSKLTLNVVLRDDIIEGDLFLSAYR